MPFAANTTLVDDFEFISEHDDAVDRGASEKEFKHRWKLYLEGTAEPPLKPNQEPTRFYLRHLRGVSINAAVSDTIARQGLSRATALIASLALVRATNWNDENGEPVKIRRVADNDGLDRVAREVMDLLPPPVVYEMGLRVLKRSELGPLS